MHRFLVRPDEIQNPTILLSPKESRHALSVLRLKTGAQVHLMDGRGQVVRGTIGSVEDGRVRVVPCGMPVEKHHSKVRVTLAVSVIKPERMEWLIEKSCELGVAAIVPLVTERCIVKISQERWRSKVERWRKIAAESCKQCGLTELPHIDDVSTFKNFLDHLPEADRFLIPTLAAPTENLKTQLNFKTVKTPYVVAFIGPEGDFTKKEVEAVLAIGGKAVSLGSLTLRSETAAICLLSILNFNYHELT